MKHDLTNSYIQSLMVEKCPYLGVVLDYENGMSETSASLDRIDNSQGYVQGNVQIISRLANQMKSTASFEQFEQMYLAWKAQKGLF